MIIKDKSKYFRKQTKVGRFYCKSDQPDIPAPSVTTVIGQQNQTNYKSKGPGPSAHIGTIVHHKILQRYTNNILPVSCDSIWNIPRSEVYGRINRCIQMWNELNLNISPIVVETALFNKDPLYAGTLDLLGKVGCNNELLKIHFKTGLFLLDIKTGLPYDSHVVQAGAYWHTLRRKPNVIFVYLDSIIDRNPEQKATIRIFTKEELEEGYNTFLDYYVEFEY